MGREGAGRDSTPRSPLAPGATKPQLSHPHALPGREVLNTPLAKKKNKSWCCVAPSSLPVPRFAHLWKGKLGEEGTWGQVLGCC